jgi:hypothetical protein
MTLPKLPGQRAADTIGGAFAQVLDVVGAQVGTLGQQLDHAHAQLAETRRAHAVERAKLAAVVELLDQIVNIDMTRPDSIRPQVRTLRRRLRRIAETPGATTPQLVGNYLRTGNGSPVWTTDTITGQRVRLIDGRVGIVHDAFAGMGGVDCITVEPSTSPVHGGRGDLVYDLAPQDVEFLGKVGHPTD